MGPFHAEPSEKVGNTDRESSLSGPTFAMLSGGSQTEDNFRYVTLTLRCINKVPLIYEKQRKLTDQFLHSVSGKPAPCTDTYTQQALKFL